MTVDTILAVVEVISTYLGLGFSILYCYIKRARNPILFIAAASGVSVLVVLCLYVISVPIVILMNFTFPQLEYMGVDLSWFVRPVIYVSDNWQNYQVLIEVPLTIMIYKGYPSIFWSQNDT